MAAHGYSPESDSLPAFADAGGNWRGSGPPNTPVGSGNEILLRNLDYTPWAAAPVAAATCAP